MKKSIKPIFYTIAAILPLILFTFLINIKHKNMQEHVNFTSEIDAKKLGLIDVGYSNCVIIENGRPVDNIKVKLSFDYRTNQQTAIIYDLDGTKHSGVIHADPELGQIFTSEFNNGRRLFLTFNYGQRICNVDITNLDGKHEYERKGILGYSRSQYNLGNFEENYNIIKKNINYQQ